MEPIPVPKKITDVQIGTVMLFGPPEGMEDEVGELQILNIMHPEQARAILLGQAPPHEPGSRDYFVCWWQPNDLERDQIHKGAPIRLTFIGLTALNPMRMEVGANLAGLQDIVEGN